MDKDASNFNPKATKQVYGDCKYKAPVPFGSKPIAVFG